MNDRIASFYLDEQVELRSLLLPSKHSTEQWSYQLISNHTNTSSILHYSFSILHYSFFILHWHDEGRATKFPRMNLCLYIIICTKLLHNRRLLCKNNIPPFFLFYLFSFIFEELHEFAQGLTFDILNTNRWMGRISNLIDLYR